MDLETSYNDIKKLIIVNVYAPAEGVKQRLKYFQELDKVIESKLNKIDTDFNFILTGDFNCVIDPNHIGHANRPKIHWDQSLESYVSVVSGI